MLVKAPGLHMALAMTSRKLVKPIRRAVTIYWQRKLELEMMPGAKINMESCTNMSDVSSCS